MFLALEHFAPGLGSAPLVLDLGSGAGHVAYAVRACGGRSLCIDIERDVLASSRTQYPGGEHVAADAACLPLADRSVDAIYCFSVLQYVSRTAALIEMHRVLKPGGRVVIVENLGGGPWALGYRMFRRLSGPCFPARLTAMRRLSWDERAGLTDVFPGARVDAFCLLSIVWLLLPQVWRGTEKSLGWLSGPIRTTNRLDAFLLARFEWLWRGAWLLLLRR